VGNGGKYCARKGSVLGEKTRQGKATLGERGPNDCIDLRRDQISQEGKEAKGSKKTKQTRLSSIQMAGRQALRKTGGKVT